jgi:predicted DNA-binding transcriptional regulator YafY
MEAVLDPTARTLRLLSLLQTHRFWPGAELAERLEVSARTLRRDIDRLRALGYPVDATPGVAGGYRLAAGAHLPPLLLDDDEAVAIAVGLRAAAGAAVAGIEDTTVGALAKLEQVLPDRLRRRVKAVHSNVSVLRWDGEGPTVDPEALAVLAQGCRDREEVRFDYRRRDGEETRRLVQPYQLVSADRRWYLVAWDKRRGDWRTFRVDRLSDPRLAGPRFEPRELPAADAAAFVEQSLQATPRDHEADVVVHVPAERLQAVARWFQADLEAVDDETCRLHLRSESIPALAWMVTVLAVHGEIEIEPAARGDLRELLGAIGGRLTGAV